MEIVRSVGALAEVPGGGVDAADTANNRIQAYDAGGNLWVADTGNDRVVELDPGNAVLYTSPAGLLAGPSAVATGPAGTYVADTGHGRVVLLAPGGAATIVGGGLRQRGRPRGRAGRDAVRRRRHP